MEEAALDHLTSFEGPAVLAKADQQGLILVNKDGQTTDFPILRVGEAGEQSRVCALVIQQAFGNSDQTVLRNLIQLTAIVDQLEVVAKNGDVTVTPTYRFAA